MNAEEIKEDLRRRGEARLAAQAMSRGDGPPEIHDQQRAEPSSAEETGQFSGVISRPGVSSGFLLRNGIRHVDEEQAEALSGFRAPGIWIPYPGLNSRKMVVNHRQFGRLRPDRPLNGNKYLSPRGSGAQLYIPQGSLFGKEIVICEGEFKALALCEANIRAVGIGGIQSAMSEGEAIPDLRRILQKYNPSTIYFLGDSDTALIFDFSREAAKLARAVAPATLKVPRIPLSMPKGIDDVKEVLGHGFLDFWQRIIAEAIEVGPRLSPDALAVELLAPQLPYIVQAPDRPQLESRIVELASYLDEVNLDKLAVSVKDHLELPVVGFRNTARAKAKRRAEDHASKAREAKTLAIAAVNDPRPKIELPGANRLLSAFGEELGQLLAKQAFFVKDRVVVQPNTEGNGMDPVSGRGFRTAIERHVVPYYQVQGKGGAVIGFDRTLAKEDAESLLVCPQFIETLPVIRAVNNARFPVARADGRVELLLEGYDSESMIFTIPGGPDIEDLGGRHGAQMLRILMEEFCFREDDRERALAVSVAAMLTLFNAHVLPRATQRPGFIFSANSEGSGKSLLAKLAMIPRMGTAPTGTAPETEEEMKKFVFSSLLAGSPVIFLDNVKRHLSSDGIESAMTASIVQGRVLGQSRVVNVENMSTVFITGNGATISPDLRRRLLLVELFLREARPEDRHIKNPLDDLRIQTLRGEILTALWSITKAWAEAGRPKPAKSHASFPVWAEIIGGIVEHAGFASPCSIASTTISGDRETEDFEKLVAALAERHPNDELRFGDIVALCRELTLFSRLVGEQDQDFDPGKRNVFSRILTKFNNRVFSTGTTFRINERSKNSKAFYVEK